MARLFLSLLPSSALIDAVTPIMQGIPGARWIRPDHVHLTLRFIGPTSPDRARELAAVMHEVRHQPFTLEYAGVGTFPELSSRHRLNVLWVGVAASEQLLSLARKIESHVQMTGFRAEQRPFHPHITIARIADTSPYDVDRWLHEHGELTLPSMEVDAFHLMQSTFTPDGVEYDVRETFPLKERGLPGQ